MSTFLSDGNRFSCDAGDATDADPSTACSAEYEDKRVGNVEVGNAAGYGVAAGDLHTAIMEGHAVYIPTTTGTATIGVALGEIGVSEFPRVRGGMFPVLEGVHEGWPLTSLTSVLAYAKWLNKLPLRLRERRQVARDFHQRMYTAFAE